MKAFLHRGGSVADPSDVESERAFVSPTPELILGPFYPADRVPRGTSDLTKLANQETCAAGNQIFVSVRIVDEDGNPLESVCVEFWQANASGRYRHELDRGPAPLDACFDGFAIQITDDQGRLAFKTVKPGAYPTPLGETRAPHIHFQLTDGARRLVTQMFFAGERLNAEDRCLQSCRNPAMLVACATTPAKADLPEFSWQIVLSRRMVVRPTTLTLIESQR